MNISCQSGHKFLSVESTSRTTALKPNIAIVFWEEQHTKEKKPDAVPAVLKKPQSVPQVNCNVNERRCKKEEMFVLLFS